MGGDVALTEQDALSQPQPSHDGGLAQRRHHVRDEEDRHQVAATATARPRKKDRQQGATAMSASSSCGPAVMHWLHHHYRT